MNSYFYEYTARDRIKEWHDEADQARRVRMVKAKKRRGRRPTRLLTQAEPRLKLPTAPVLDDLVQG